MKQPLLIITSTCVLLSYSCGSSTQEKATSENAKTDSVATVQTQVANQNASTTNEFKDIITLFKKDGSKYQVIKADKELKITVNERVNSKFSDWTPAKIYAYLSGDNFEVVSTAINNNSDGDFHYETKNIKFNVSNQTMTGGTYLITNKH